MSKEKNATQTQSTSFSPELVAFLTTVIEWPIEMYAQLVPGKLQKDILPNNIVREVVRSEAQAISLFNAGWRNHPDKFLSLAGTIVDAQMRQQIDIAKLAGVNAQITKLQADLKTLSEQDTEGRAKILSDIANFEAAKVELEAALGV